MESWICQISGLQDALNADYAAVQGGKTTKQSSKVPNHLVSSLNSKRSEISRSGSVLKHLLNLSKENPEIMQFNSQGCYEAADVLIKVVKSYTQIDDLTDSAPCHVPILVKFACFDPTSLPRLADDACDVFAGRVRSGENLLHLPR